MMTASGFINFCLNFSRYFYNTGSLSSQPENLHF